MYIKQQEISHSFILRISIRVHFKNSLSKPLLSSVRPLDVLMRDNESLHKNNNL